MIAWLQGEIGPTTQTFYEKLSEEFRAFLEEQRGSFVWFFALCGFVLILIGIKRLLAPRAQRAREIAELFRRLAQANGLTAEEAKRIEEAVRATNLENPAHLFARPTVYEAAARAVVAGRLEEKERLTTEYDALRNKLFST